MCHRNSDSRARRSSAFLVLGMIFLSLAVLEPLLFPSRSPLSGDADLRDFFHGLLYGLSFAFNIGSIALQRRPPSSAVR